VLSLHQEPDKSVILAVSGDLSLQQNKPDQQAPLIPRRITVGTGFQPVRRLVSRVDSLVKKCNIEFTGSEKKPMDTTSTG
jgi:hypothetical protein